MPSTEKFDLNEGKLAELILHVAKKSQADVRFGKTKLNKLLFYMDFWHYAMTGKPITGATYRNDKFGPVPEGADKIKRQLREAHASAVQKTTYFGRDQWREINLREPNVEIFNGSEIELANWVIKQLWDHDGTEVSDLSHELPAWKFTSRGDTIPYELVFLDDRELTQEEKDYALEQREAS